MLVSCCQKHDNVNTEMNKSKSNKELGKTNTENPLEENTNIKTYKCSLRRGNFNLVLKRGGGAKHNPEIVSQVHLQRHEGGTKQGILKISSYMDA